VHPLGTSHFHLQILNIQFVYILLIIMKHLNQICRIVISVLDLWPKTQWLMHNIYIYSFLTVTLFRLFSYWATNNIITGLDEENHINFNMQDLYKNLNKKNDWLIFNGFIGKKWDSDTKKNATLSSARWLRMSKWSSTY